MATPIPAFYRVCFTILDPMIAGFGLYANIFRPEFVLNGFTPHPQIPPAPETNVLLCGMAGFFAMLIVLQCVLLRLKAHDATVWCCVQAGILLQDLLMIAAFVNERQEAGRLDPQLWNGNDWAKSIVYPGLVILRASFIVTFSGAAKFDGKTTKSD